jgi:hypothetical protein
MASFMSLRHKDCGSFTLMQNVEIAVIAIQLIACFYFSHGLVGHRTNSNSGQFKNPLVVVYYDVDYVKNVKGTNYWRNRFVNSDEVMKCT